MEMQVTFLEIIIMEHLKEQRQHKTQDSELLIILILLITLIPFVFGCEQGSDENVTGALFYRKQGQLEKSAKH